MTVPTSQKEIAVSYKEVPTSMRGFNENKASSNATVDLNKRLNEFNSKLQMTIGKNDMQHSQSQKLISFWENERRDLIERYEGEIKELKG